MRKLRFLICIILSLQLFCVRAFAVDSADKTVTAGSHSIDAAVPYLGVAQITENTLASFLYEVNSDTLMYSNNADTQTYPSSLVKIITAFLAVQEGNLDDIITVTESALSSVPYYAASAELKAGEQLSLRDLLYCMMVGSANDAAAVIAEHIGGSQSAFVELMNQQAKELGCTATQFTNCHGLHDEQQYTTVRDMARILCAAIKNEDFVTFFSTINYVVPATNMSGERELSSGNYLMNTENLQIYYDDRVTGGRTGIADDGTRCLASCAEKNGMQLICIVVGSESTYADDGNTVTYGSFKESSSLYDAGFDGYRVAQVIYEGQALKQCSVVNGANDVVLASTRSVYCVLPENATVNDLSYQYADNAVLQAPLDAGQSLATVQIWHGSSCVAQADLVSMNSVSSISVSQDDTTQQQSGGAGKIVLIVILSVVGCVAVFALVLLLIRTVRISQVKNHRRRHSRDRRRSR